MNQTTLIANIGTAVRILITLFAGNLIAAGKLDPTQVDTIAGGVAVVVVAVWGVWKNYSTHTNTVASVQKAVTTVTAAPEQGPVVVAAAKAGKL